MSGDEELPGRRDHRCSEKTPLEGGIVGARQATRRSGPSALARRWVRQSSPITTSFARRWTPHLRRLGVKLQRQRRKQSTPRAGRRRGRAARDQQSSSGGKVRLIRSTAGFATTVDGKTAVVEYEPDPDLRDTEQVPLLEEGGVDAFLAREVLPYTPDAWYDRSEHQDRLRDQLHARVLQAAAAALAGGDPRGHSRAGAGDRRSVGRHRRRSAHVIDGAYPYGATREERYPDGLERCQITWHVLPGLACYRQRNVSNIGLRTQVLSLSFGRIVIRPQEKLRGLVPASFETYQIIEPGDIVVRPTDLQNDWNGLRFGLSAERGIITSAYICSTHDAVADSRVSVQFAARVRPHEDLYGLGYGSSSESRAGPTSSTCRCLVPPLDEQAAIVHFLDHADRRIRRGIRAKQKLIAMLNEQKQAVIHGAVTRGLDPNVRLKPSELQWLGDVPEHWDVRPFSRSVVERADDRERAYQDRQRVFALRGRTSGGDRSITPASLESRASRNISRSSTWASKGRAGHSADNRGAFGTSSLIERNRIG